MYRDFLKRKEKVIISAIELLDESGIQGLTTKEIAKRQGITEAAIYKQFESKKEIVLTILQRFAAFDEVIMNTIIEQKMSPKEGIFYFAEAYAGYYQGYPEISTVLFSFDVYRYEGETKQRMTEIMDKRFVFVNTLVAQGQELRELPTQLSSNELANIVLGLIWSMTFEWKFNDSKEDLKKSIITSLEWVLR